MHLVLTLMLTFTAAAGQHKLVFTAKVNDEVTLPCDGVTGGENNCDRTTWSLMSTLMLFEAGQIHINASNRLGISDKCSLVIKKVSFKDVGRYTCKQLTSGQQEQNSTFYLSVVQMAKRKLNDTVVLNCTVVDLNFHMHAVEWQYEGKGENSSHTTLSPPNYHSTTLLKNPLHQNSKFVSTVKCKVTNVSTKKVQLFTFSHRSTVQDPGRSRWHIVVSVASTGTVIIVLVFIKWKKSKGAKIKKEKNTADPEEDVSYASISHDKIKRKSKNCYSVTDRTLNSSSPKPTTDADVIYSPVKQKQLDVTE